MDFGFRWHLPGVTHQAAVSSEVYSKAGFEEADRDSEYTISDELRLSHTFLEELERLKGPGPSKDSIMKNPIKVAVIDNGVDQCRTSISDSIERGESFVEIRSESGMVRESPWWLVADPHGTQMASLITQVNPYCKLYVGKVGRYRGDLLVENVVKVRHAQILDSL